MNKSNQSVAGERLHQLYLQTVRPDLQKSLGLSNIMEVPRISKIVLNVGVKEAVADSKSLRYVMDMLAKIAGQLPIKTIAKKSIAGFKLREGMAIGTKVTLRGKNMYAFLDKFINVVLPKVRDFQGVTRNLDGRGNYNVGIREWTIFPEMEDYDMSKKIYGLNITIETTSKKDSEGFALLQSFGMPFRSEKN